jgi:wyosine [tRNA(Phe)-imidazoG37] synthetase (radical SAM superfamily)
LPDESSHLWTPKKHRIADRIFPGTGFEKAQWKICLKKRMKTSKLLLFEKRIWTMYEHLFGPVPSRRLGMSLGIDLVPHKVCTLNCVYCECGPTNRLTLRQHPYIPVEAVKQELSHYLDHHPAPDYITFSGSGEPTLNAGIGEVLSFIKGLHIPIPVAILTNGTLLNHKAVRDSILGADLVLPSLDAVSDAVFEKINRPHPGLAAKDCIQGLIDFRNSFAGRIWLEIFILPGYNDNPEELGGLNAACDKIRPDRIQLNTLDRPGSVGDLMPVSRATLEQIAQVFTAAPVEIVSAAAIRKNMVAFRGDVETTILETIRRRPCTKGSGGVLSGHN